MSPRTVKVARSAVTGRFVSKDHELRHRETTVVEIYEMETSKRRVAAETPGHRPNRPS